MIKKSNFETKYSLQEGDVLVRSKSAFGIVDHYGIYVGNGNVIDNHPDRGVSLIDINSFLNCRELKRIDRFKANHLNKDVVIDKAFSMIGLKYHLTDFNCEHFVNIVLGFGKKSQQISIIGLFFFLSLIVWGLGKTS